MSLSLYSTNDLREGSHNRYFTDPRARNTLSAEEPIQYDQATGVISTAAFGEFHMSLLLTETPITI